MKKILTFLMFMACAVFPAFAAVQTGTDVWKSGTVSESNEAINGTGASLDGTFVAGNGSKQSSGMSSKGVKCRTAHAPPNVSAMSVTVNSAPFSMRWLPRLRWRSPDAIILPIPTTG